MGIQQMSWRFRITAVVLVFMAAGGCVDLRNTLGPTGSDPDGGGSSPTDSNGSADGETPSDVPVVRLSVSNPSPLVGEEVVLTCSLVGTSPGVVTFDFAPADPRLSVNDRTGVATLIVDGSDIATEFAFRCTATNEAGTSAPSNEEVIIPGG